VLTEVAKPQEVNKLGKDDACIGTAAEMMMMLFVPVPRLDQTHTSEAVEERHALAKASFCTPTTCSNRLGKPSS